MTKKRILTEDHVAGEHLMTKKYIVTMLKHVVNNGHLIKEQVMGDLRQRNML